MAQVIRVNGSPRNHTADADTSLSRKRARLSEEGHSPGSSNGQNGEVLIEALPLDIEGVDLGNAIEIDGDDYNGMDRYSDGFDIWPELTPTDQCRHFRERVLSGYHLNARTVTDLCTWLRRHLDNTSAQCNEQLCDEYLHDLDFFGELALLAHALLERSEWFETDTEYSDSSEMIWHLLNDLAALSARFLLLLPDITKERLARRDSMQSRSSPQFSIPALHYINVVALLDCGIASCLQTFRTDSGLDQDNALDEWRSHLDAAKWQALVEVVCEVANNARTIRDSWPVLDAALRMLALNTNVYGAGDILCVVNESILPIVCEKHPRALPDDFHSNVVSVAADLLKTYANRTTLDHGFELYEQFVKKDGDALLPGVVLGVTPSEALQTVCKHKQDTLAALLSAAWTLHAHKSFIFSSIMDIRSCGISMMSVKLREWHLAWRKTADDGTNQAVVDFVARFLRINNLTSYIFSPESHASIVSHSKDIVAFLAATHHYTDHETDIMWQACTTSVEADFAKASMGVLEHVGRHVAYDQLFYIAQKFASAPITMLKEERPAELLAFLFRRSREICPLDGQHRCARDAAFLAVKVIRRIHSEDDLPSACRTWGVAMTAISHLVELGMEDRLALYELCIPDIVNRTDWATCSYEILSLFFKGRKSNEEAGILLAMLPPAVVVEESSEHMTRIARNVHADHNARSTAITVRLDAAVSLMSLGPYIRDAAVEDALFDAFCGERAPTDFERHSAWSRLATLRSAGPLFAAAESLLDYYLSARMTVLPAAHVPQSLVELMTPILEHHLRITAECSEPLDLLQHPLWKLLVRVATDCPMNNVSSCATNVICYVLFAVPRTFSSKSAIMECHSQFINGYIQKMCADYDDKSSSDENGRATRLCQSISVMSTILHQSRETQDFYQIAQQPKSCDLTHGKLESSDMDFTGQVNHPCRPQESVSFHASQTNIVADLIAALPSLVGVGESRIIVGGRQLDSEQEGIKPLVEVVAPAGVIMICPRYNSDTDLEKVLTAPGPVEREIIGQYNRLEAFLDGISSVAKSMFCLLTQLRPPVVSRLWVSSVGATSSSIFPPGGPYRTAFSSHVLRTHLQDFAKLAVADEQFIMRAIGLYCAFVTDEDRVFNPLLLNTILPDFLLFLQGTPASDGEVTMSDSTTDAMLERSTEDNTVTIFDDPNKLVARLYDLLRRTASLEPTPIRTSLSLKLYEVMIEAMRSDKRIWPAFASLEENDLSALHAQLLLDNDVALSSRLAEIVTNLCADAASPTGAQDFYWGVISRSINKALERPFTASAFFKVATDLLSMNRALQQDEAAVRIIIQTLASELWRYQHVETPHLQVVDNAAVGLLGLLHSAVVLLKSFKNPLDCLYLSVDVMKKLLFPNDDSSAPLLSDVARGIAFEIVKATCETSDDFKTLAVVSTSAMQAVTELNPTLRFPNHSDWIKPPGQCTGLTNLGMTCYMNSLLQQMFANLAFRRLIFDTVIVNLDRQNFLVAIQELFARMQNTNELEVHTKDLASILKIQTDSQEDVHGFYAIFLSRLEDCMPDQKSKDSLNNMFAGTFKSQVKGECGHVSTQTEAFNDVSITLKNKASLQDSLAEFVQGEPMQGANRYRCLTCDATDGGRLVNAMKRTALDQVPNNLTFCLKRFTFEAMMGAEGKVNDRFEFPQKIDMSMFETEHLEHPGTPVAPDIFELVGVIVHQGSLQFGHYWSYVRLRGPDVGNGAGVWVQLEDKHARPCPGGVEEVQEQCFGGTTYTNGQERTDNAYVLFYQRKQHLHEQAQLATPSGLPQASPGMFPPRVEPPEKLVRAVFDTNLFRLRQDQVFNPQFSSFTNWLLESIPEEPVLDFIIGELATAYLLRVVLCSPALFKKHLTTFLASITRRSASNQASFTDALIRCLVSVPSAFGWIWCHQNSTVRVEISTFLLTCLSTLRESESSRYHELLQAVIAAHAYVRVPNLDNQPALWSEYLDFVVGIARYGPKETAVVLDHGVLDWAYEVLFVSFDQNFARRHPVPAKKTRTDQIELGPLFNLLSGVLAEHVDIDAPPTPDDLSHQISDDGKAILRNNEWRFLFLEYALDGRKIWLLGYVGSQRCSPTVDWECYPPGKLLRLLTTPRSEIEHILMVETMLLWRYEKESALLGPFLQMTLHYCASAVDRDLLELFRDLGRNLAQWIAVGECLEFYKIAFKLKPRAVIESIPSFVPAFMLDNKLTKARQKTLDWLAEQVFVDPTPDNPNVTSCTRIARALAKTFLPRLEYEYRSEHVRRPYEQAIGTMKVALTFLTTIHDEWLHLKRHSENPRLSPEHYVEYEESKSTIKSLKSTLDELEDWIVEPVNGDDLSIIRPFTTEAVADDSEAEAGDTDLEDDDYESV